MMPPKSLRISALPSLGDSVRVLFFQCGGFRAFWRNLVLICLEIQHGIAPSPSMHRLEALKYKNFFQNCFFNFNGKFFPFRLFLLLTRNLVWICNIMKTLRKSRIKVKSPLEVTDMESGKLFFNHTIFKIHIKLTLHFIHRFRELLSWGKNSSSKIAK